MSAMSNESRKRRRENEEKKWTEDEVKKIFDAPDTDPDDSLEIDEPGSSSADDSFSEKGKRTSIDKLVAMEAQRKVCREKQLTLETEKLNWAKEVEKKKLDMELQKLEMDKRKLDMGQQKLQIELQKINNDFQIKKLELEQNERLKMFELEMKYKNNK